MSEAAFPVLGAAFVMLVVLPACALLVKGILLLLERTLVGPLQALRLRYVLISASSAVPLAWFLSAALHQIEPGTLRLACLLDHEAASLCLEPASFALLLVASVAAACFASLRGRERVEASTSVAAAELRARIARLVASHPSLDGLRVIVTDQLDAATVGLLRPRAVMGVAFAARLSDAMLVAALSHEQQHVRVFDPLRYLLLDLALRVNPLGRSLLAPHVARWKDARETLCDREAVISGAQPLPLAEALLRAARPAPHGAPALAPDSLPVLKFRVGLLLAFAERRPKRRHRDGVASLPVAFALLLIALLLPHQTGTEPLDVLHIGIEQVFTPSSR